jgi:hypothetical protein
MKTRLFILIISYCFLLSAISCKKDSFITSADARLTTSVDTLHFDTVFTSTGSITKSFKIINDNNQKLRLTKLKLMGGPASAYKINVDGTASSEINNLEIAANDSIYVFVSVTINPNLTNLSFIVKDSILINYNGNNRFVQLEAFGQNANFLRNRKITGNVVWTNNLPYVIIGSLIVDTTASLTIQPGCRIYSHADAPFVVDGTLIINGTKSDSVTFAGDRLDPDYKDLPASWPGIYFRGSSKNNIFKYAVINNAYQAVVVEKPSVNANPKLVLSQCMIDNAYDAGFLFVNTSVNADNCLVTNCGNNIALSYGGTYNIVHCTVAGFSNFYINHKNPVLQINNYALQGSGFVTANLNAVLRNCIFWGDAGFVENEVVVNKQGSTSFAVSMNNCLYRAVADPGSGTQIQNCIKNSYPAFDSININKKIYNFRTGSTTAPGINKGMANVPVLLKDLDDKNRNNGLPDMGCYEKQ